MNKPVAALDCGSNSTRLLVLDHHGQTVHRDIRITRLSRGVDKSGVLDEEAIERTLVVLRDYLEVMKRYGVDRSHLVATSAVRDAKNGSEFLDAARLITGGEASILSGAEEAEFSYLGAATDLPDDGIANVMVDIGGGSTELVTLANDRIAGYSMQLGCVRLAERSLGYDVPTQREIDETRAIISEELARALEAVPALARVKGRLRFVGLAGTVATLVRLSHQLATYDASLIHHQVIDRAEVTKWRNLLAGETSSERLAHPGLESGREDVIVAGLLILEAVMDELGATTVLSSEMDILDGVANALLQR